MPGYGPVSPPPLPSYGATPPPSLPATMFAASQQPAAYTPAPAPPTPGAQAERKTNPLPWLLIPLCLLVVAVIAVIGFRRSSPVSNSSNFSTSYNTNYNTSANSNRGTTVSSTPYPNGRLAVCRFTPVHVRDAPRLDAAIITDISTGQRVWVIRESSNYDTVFVRSLNRSVNANWSEIEVENSSVHGWVFSGFLQ